MRLGARSSSSTGGAISRLPRRLEGSFGVQRWFRFCLCLRKEDSTVDSTVFFYMFFMNSEWGYRDIILFVVSLTGLSLQRRD